MRPRRFGISAPAGLFVSSRLAFARPATRVRSGMRPGLNCSSTSCSSRRSVSSAPHSRATRRVRCSRASRRCSGSTSTWPIRRWSAAARSGWCSSTATSPCWPAWRRSARAPSSRSWARRRRALGPALAGRWRAALGAFAVSLAVLHIGAEWTSLRDRTFLGRIGLAVVAITLAAVGGGIAPLAFVALVCAAVLGQLLLEALTPRGGAASVYEPIDRT